MHLSRIVIKKFRNFGHLDVALHSNVVVVGENGVGRDRSGKWIRSDQG